MNMAVPVSFIHRDRALGGARLSADLAGSAGAAGAAWLALDSFAAAAAASTTAAKLVPELLDGAGAPKLFIVEARWGSRIQFERQRFFLVEIFF
jgi:hypothetical protein